VLNPVLLSIQHQELRLPALGRWMLRYQFRRKLKVKIGGSHTKVSWFNIRRASREVRKNGFWHNHRVVNNF
jgi:hypothetical protein